MFNLVLVHSASPDLTSIKQSSHIEVNQVAISQLALKKKNQNYLWNSRYCQNI